MPRAAFTKAALARAWEVARSSDPPAVVEVTPDGCIRLLPTPANSPQPAPREREPEEW